MKFEFIGWCKKDNHDKVWVMVHVGKKTATIWGRRGKTLQYKVFQNLRYFQIDKLVDSKKSKGYIGISETELDTVYPDFQEDVEKTAVWALLNS